MSLGSRCRRPLTAALAGVLLGGVLACAPAAGAAPGSDPKPSTATPEKKRDKSVSKPTKASLLTDQLGAARDGLTRSEATYKKSAYLCYGYANCTSAGYSNAGYEKAGKKMYWRMYAGHNCTNYVAYRMVQNGMPNVRPWTGGGNATYWGTSVPQLTDGTPSVGAVAWWKANTGPAGSAGHVAYVEQVVSPDEIIVSQDSWNGDFSWARITRSSGNWPSGFIHFTDLTVQNTAAPVITGDLRVGTQLTATPGTWSPAATAVGYQWFANGQPIKGATAPTLSLGKGRVGQTISVLTTATREGYNTQTAAATASAPVQPGVLANTAAPGLSGTAKVEDTLTVTPGTWSPLPSGYSYAWFANGTPIPNATGSSLTLTPELVGQSITASATATRAGYADATLGTVATAPVAPGTIRVRKQPVVTGVARPGHTLTATTGTYRPADTTATVQWLRDGVPIEGAVAPTYTVTEADLGTLISASVSASRAGYDTAVLSTQATAPVKVLPRIKVQRVQLRHGVRLVIQVVARYVPVVQGNVIVKVKRGFVKKVALNPHGVARVVVVGLRQGKHPARVGFTGAPTVQKSIRKAAIRMPAPKR